MPQPDETSEERLRRLDTRLDALEASRVKAQPGTGDLRGAAQGYRFLAEVVGGVLGGVGLGWLFDTFVHTAPWGMIVGVLLGFGISIWMAVQSAKKMSAEIERELGPPRDLPPDDEED